MLSGDNRWGEVLGKKNIYSLSSEKGKTICHLDNSDVTMMVRSKYAQIQSEVVQSLFTIVSEL